jgi:hypothetical protein
MCTVFPISNFRQIVECLKTFQFFFNFSVKLLSVLKNFKISVKNTSKMEIFRKSLPILAILAQKVIPGDEEAKNTTKESFPGYFNPEQLVLAQFWFASGFICGIFVTFLGISAKKYLDPIMADNPDWLKRLNASGMAKTIEPKPTMANIETNDEAPKEPELTTMTNFIDSSEVTTTPLDRWVDEPTKKWRVLERTINFQQMTHVTADPKLEKTTLPPVDHTMVPWCGETPVAADLEEAEVEKTTSLSKFKRDEEPSVDHKKESLFGDPVETEVEKMTSFPDQMVLEEQTKMNSLAYWSGLAMTLAALAIAGFVVTKSVESEQVKSLMIDSLEKMQTSLKKLFRERGERVKMDSQAAQSPVMSYLDQFINKWVERFNGGVARITG